MPRVFDPPSALFSIFLHDEIIALVYATPEQIQDIEEYFPQVRVQLSAPIMSISALEDHLYHCILP